MTFSAGGDMPKTGGEVPPQFDARQKHCYQCGCGFIQPYRAFFNVKTIWEITRQFRR